MTNTPNSGRSADRMRRGIGRRQLIAALGAVAAGGGLAGCAGPTDDELPGGGESPVPAERTNVAPYEDDVLATARANRAGVVTLSGDRTFGTGFLVHEDGYLFTNAHLVQRLESLEVGTAEGTRATAEVVARGGRKQPDLAVLQLDDVPGELTALDFGELFSQSMGEIAYDIGHPGSFGNWVITAGPIEAIGEELTISKPGSPGQSGAPVFDSTGDVVGITYGSSTDRQEWTPLSVDHDVVVWTGNEHQFRAPTVSEAEPVYRMRAFVEEALGAELTGEIFGAAGTEPVSIRPDRKRTTTPAPVPANRTNVAPYEEELLAVAQKCRPSIASLVGEAGGSGTGAVVHEEYLFTNAHVVGRQETMTATFPDGDEYTAEVVASADPERVDLAVLRVRESLTDVPALAFGSASSQSVGDRVFSIGHPNVFGEWVVTAGPLTERTDDQLVADKPGGSGESGAPLFDADGHVVGIVHGAEIRHEKRTALDENDDVVVWSENDHQYRIPVASTSAPLEPMRAFVTEALDEAVAASIFE